MAEGTVRYALEGDTWFIVLAGDLRYHLGPVLDDLLNQALARPQSRFVIDLSRAEGIDSTCLGILARIANRVPDPTDSKPVRPVIITGGEDIYELLSTVCFDSVFDLVESIDHQISNHLQSAIPIRFSKSEDMLTLMLEAHRRLSVLDAKNHDTFKNVVMAMESEIAKVKPNP